MYFQINLKVSYVCGLYYISHISWFMRAGRFWLKSLSVGYLFIMVSDEMSYQKDARGNLLFPLTHSAPVVREIVYWFPFLAQVTYDSVCVYFVASQESLKGRWELGVSWEKQFELARWFVNFSSSNFYVNSQIDGILKYYKIHENSETCVVKIK